MSNRHMIYTNYLAVKDRCNTLQNFGKFFGKILRIIVQVTNFCGTFTLACASPMDEFLFEVIS